MKAAIWIVAGVAVLGVGFLAMRGRGGMAAPASPGVPGARTNLAPKPKTGPSNKFDALISLAENADDIIGAFRDDSQPEKDQTPEARAKSATAAL